MYTRNIYTLPEVIVWTRFESAFFFIYCCIWVALYFFLDLQWLRIPWTAIALIGTAVSFVIGFQNNSVYGRIWEARKIWGGIVNTSRTFGIYSQDFIENRTSEPISDSIIQEQIRILTYRHIAWLTALRYSMRAEKEWETTHNKKTNKEWGLNIPERTKPLKDVLQDYISKEDLNYVQSKGNPQTALLYLQSHHLKELKNQNLIWEFSFLKMEGVLEELFTLQGKSERIKNFPFPRQYATINHLFMWCLLILLPLAMVPQFAEIGRDISEGYPIIGRYFVWLSILFYTAVAWIFHTMERIGRTGENPFEGTSNDVPISTIARGIEIDLRQNLGEHKEDIPTPLTTEHHIQW